MNSCLVLVQVLAAFLFLSQVQGFSITVKWENQGSNTFEKIDGLNDNTETSDLIAKLADKHGCDYSDVVLYLGRQRIYDGMSLKRNHITDGTTVSGACQLV